MRYHPYFVDHPWHLAGTEKAFTVFATGHVIIYAQEASRPQG
jgi:hypothetical protein